MTIDFTITKHVVVRSKQRHRKEQEPRIYNPKARMYTMCADCRQRIVVAGKLMCKVCQENYT